MTSEYIPTNPRSQRPLQIGEITGQIKDLLEESFPLCWIVGEVSNYTKHVSGHRYFTLKDDSSQLACVMFKWQSRGITFEPEVGMQLLAHGRVTVYERRGNYQFIVNRIQPSGVGELAIAFDQLKKKLQEEGLFDAGRKQPLPPFPRCIGVVTSATGAAIRDIVNVLERRAPGIQVLLRPTQVQGDGAASDIACAIDQLNLQSDVDILIVGRGGGSAEDLWCFNEETVARAIYHSTKPVISAVGHEIDYCISDFVADCRAPTPSAAAEIAAPDESDLKNQVAELHQRLKRIVGRELQVRSSRLEQLQPERLLARLQNHLDQSGQYVDERLAAIATAFDRNMNNHQTALAAAVLHLEALSPLRGLARGFTLAERRRDGQLVRTVNDLKQGESLHLRFHQGSANCQVEEIFDA